MMHTLKCWPEDFAAVVAGTKTHEARAALDRIFAVGDVLLLQEWIPSNPEACNWKGSGFVGDYTGRDVEASVTHVTQGQYGLPPSLCIMSIRVVR